MVDYTFKPIESLKNIVDRNGRKRVVLIAIPQALPMELAGPIQVFQYANFFLELSGRSDLGYDIEVVTTKSGTVFEVNGLQMNVHKAYIDVQGDVDTIIFQPMDFHGKCLNDENFLSWVKKISSKTRRMVSICTGLYILASAGIMDGRCATTHWSACEDFKKRFPKVKLDPDPIYTKDGNIYTSAGASSGLDLMLALIEEDFGSELALSVAQDMVVFLRRPASQSQFSVYMTNQYPDDPKMQKIQGYIMENLSADLTIETLSELISMSPRNFTRVFTNQTGISPGKFIEKARLEYARHCLEQSNLNISQIATQSGYSSRDGMRLSFNRHLRITPNEYRRRFTHQINLPQTLQ